MLNKNETRERVGAWRAAVRLAAGSLLALMALLGLSCAWAASPKPVGTTIGAIVPESWPNKSQGEDIRDGMLLALKTWPGLPAPTLVVHDSACDQKKAASAAQALIDAKVDVVVSGFCVLGAVPLMTQAAGVPFVSANAERLAVPPEASMQLGVVPVNLADGLAARLRAATGLRITASTACWIDFEPTVSEKYDAVLCPALHVDSARWDEIAPTYTAAYRKPFTPSAARGYAAMQVALAAVRQLRAGSKPVNAFKDAREVTTLLGKVRFHDEATPEDAMHLLFAPKLPRLSPREGAALDEIMKSKGCGCGKTGACPHNASWSSMPFVVPCCGKGGICTGAVASAH